MRNNIPNDWKVVEVQDIADVFRGSSPRPKGDPRYYGGSVPRLMGADVTRDGKYVTPQIDYLTEEGAKLSRPVPAGSLILICSGLVGVPAIMAVDCCIHDGFLGLKNLSKRVEIEYLYYSFSHVRERFDASATHGGVFTNLTTRILKEFQFPLPPFPEQRKIAEILSTWDKVISLTDHFIATLKERKKGLMQRLLTGEVRFPEFEKEWETTKLDEIGEFSKGSGIRKSDLLEYGVPCIRYGEIYTTYHFLFEKFHSFISPEIASTSKKIFPYDILFAGSGETPEEIGKCVAYIGKETAYAGGDVIILRLSEGDAKYLGYLLNHYTVNRQKYRFGQGHSIVHIYSRHLKDIAIPFPPIEEQRRISEVLEISDQEIHYHQNKLTLLQKQKKGLMQRLLTGEVRVKL